MPKCVNISPSMRRSLFIYDFATALSVSVSSNFVWGKKKQKFRQGAILVYTILYYVYMRNINVTI